MSTTFGSKTNGLPSLPKREGSLAALNTSDTIPPSDFDTARTLVLCFDGTGDQFDSDNSNVVAFFAALNKGDPERQMVYYQAGIGTYGGKDILTKTSELLDQAIAWNLQTHITDGYEFLMQNYRNGDKICVFGFSRGAYTARCLAGMVHKVGLLPTCNHQQVPFAYKMYARTDEEGWAQSNAFKKAFSIDVDIEFLGVWDTVNSVGIIPHRLPFTTSNTMVRFFRHAVALDERRAKFKANTWNRPTPEEEMLSITDQEAAMKAQKAEERKAKGANKHKGCMHQFEAQHSTILHETNVQEVWFAGCHCDVGGGSVPNGTKHSLARIPLRWMIRQCFETKTGIMFKTEELRKLGLIPNTLHPIVLPRPRALSPQPSNFVGRIPTTQPSILTLSSIVNLEEDPYFKMSEEEHALQDALSPKYDQLELAKTWWLGEFLPMRHRHQEADDKWTKAWSMNLGGGRDIPQPSESGMKVKIHRSVRTRMDAAFEDGEKYAPMVTNLDVAHVEWVD